jgi:hypothetical protein
MLALETFHATKEFLSLTAQQRAWVDAFIELLDAREATRRAYGDVGERYVAMTTRRIELSKRVIAALDVFYARTPREKFIRDLELTMAHAKTATERADARALYAKIALGFGGLSNSADSGNDGQEARTPARFKVGDIAIRADKTKLRITAVDEQGRVTDAEPIP